MSDIENDVWTPPERLLTPADAEAQRRALEMRRGVRHPVLDSRPPPGPEDNPILHHANLTDAGNAECFVALFGDLVRFDHARKRWLVWDSHRWLPDADAAVQRMALTVARARHRSAVDAADSLDSKVRENISIHALRSESRSRLDATLAIASTMLPVADDGKGWDETPWLLGAPNGVIDLRTGELRDGKPEDKITMQVGVEYDPEARAPRFARFLREVLAPTDAPEEADALAVFVRRLAGYSLTGDPSEHVIPFCKGIGGNGKSLMLSAFSGAAGDYARALEATAIKSAKYDRHSTEVAHLELSRFAYCEELGDDKLNSNRLKHLSGSKVITARKMHKDSTEYRPTWCIWLTTNGLPQTDDHSWGFWRRILVIDFPHVFKQSDEPGLAATLEAERAGILTGIVRGAVEYGQEGLGEYPRAVLAATSDYRDDIDPLEGLFASGVLVADAEARTPTAELYVAYMAWAESMLIAPAFRKGQDAFAKSLSDRFERYRIGGGKGRGFVGVRVDVPRVPPVSVNTPTREITGSDLSDVPPDVAHPVTDSTHWKDAT